MSNSNQNGYLLLSISDEWYNELSLEEIQALVKQNQAWYERLAAQGKIKGGQALARQGAVVTGKTTRFLSDGPFPESKEAIGGFLWLDVATIEEAIAIAQTIPGLRHNTTVEIRPVAAECPIYARARELAESVALATATS
jgi:hypothetical protein